MPKSPNDSLALLVFLLCFISGGILIGFAARRLTDPQRATLSHRGRLNLLSFLSAMPLIVAYYYAPLMLGWAVVVALAAILFAALVIVRYHTGQDYKTAVRTLFVAGFSLQFAGALFAVLLRTTSEAS